MKIIIFEPHPDDLLFGPGPILLDWINEGNHDIHIVTVTDGRVCYRSGDDVLSEEAKGMTEDKVANYLKKIRTWTYARYTFNDIGKYYNF